MKKRLSFLLAMLTIVALVPAPVSAAATMRNAEGSVTQTEALDHDAFFAANSVVVTAPVSGELFAAGNSVDVTEPVGRSAFAAGNSVKLAGADYNAFAAGSQVTLRGTYGNDVYVAGSDVVIEEGTVIKGDLRAAGSRVTVRGTVEGSVYVSGNFVTMGAVVGGSVSGAISRLQFTGGSIGGDLKYQSHNDAEGLSTVTVAGSTLRETPKAEGPYWQMALAGLLWSLVSLLILGGVMILVSRRRVEDVASDIVSQRGPLIGIGLAFALLVPLAVLGLVLTMVGALLAFVLFLLYALFLILATVPAFVALGHQLAGWFRWNVGSTYLLLLVGAFAYLLLAALPLIGFFLMIAFGIAYYLPSLGGMVVRLIERRK